MSYLLLTEQISSTSFYKNKSSYKIYKDWADGTLVEFDFGNFPNVGIDGADSTGDMQFNATKCEISANPFQYDNGFQVIRLSLNVLYDSTNDRWGNASIVNLVEVADGLDQTL